MLKGLRNRYLESDFVRNLAVMLTGNGLSLIIPFILAPLLTRIYSPEDFGGFELFARFLLPLAAISALRYEFAIVLPKDEEEADGVMKLCLHILIWVTLFSAFVFIPFRDFWGDLTDNQTLPSLLWWMPAGVFFTGLLMILNQYMVRRRMYKDLAGNKVWATSSNHISKYLFGLKWASPTGLVAGHILGNVAPVISLFAKNKMFRQIQVAWQCKTPLKLILRKYRNFPLYSAPHSFYEEAHRAALFVVISAYYGEVILGLFAITIRYLRIPVQVFGSSLSQVFIPGLAQDFNEGKNIRSKVMRIMRLNGLIGFVPFAILFFYGGPIFAFVFGSEWADAGVYAEIMAPWLFFNFITSPVSLLTTIVSKQKEFLIITVIGTLSALMLAIFFASQGRAFLDLIIGITALNALMYLFLIFWFLKVTRRTVLR